MKILSLKWKMYLVGLLPLIFFIGALVYYPLQRNYRAFKETESLKSRIAVIEAASSVVHESQKERGITAGFLNGGVAFEKLEKQRNINNQKIEVLKEKLSKSSFEQAYQNQILEMINEYPIIRKKVQEKDIDLKSALKKYTGFVATLLQIELDVSNDTNLIEISSQLRGFRILEDAKESGGKLRANLTGVLAKNEAISQELFSTLVSLKAGVDEGLKSSGLVLDQESKTYISTFLNSPEWKEVNAIFSLVLKRSDEGAYDKNASDFFATITSSLNILSELIHYKKEKIVSTVDQIKDNSMKALWMISVIIFVLVLVLLLFVSLMVRSSTGKMRDLIEVLNQNSSELFGSSEEIAKTSSELSEASVEQASSLQETVSSIDEIRSMVERNAEAAKSSTTMSARSQEDAQEGKKNIDEMIISIGEIHSSNDEIMQEMKNNSENLGKIIAVISEIGEKTKVINDIVFQTKLLSFNASVEAARAGEHGKGFAVVAEEVGNLATMSGNAALEISEMLDASVGQVNDIIDNSKHKFDHLLSQSGEKVEKSTLISKKCGEALERILENVRSVNSMVQEIATASEEQSVGVNEVTKAMQQLDQVTHQNSKASQSSSKLAEKIKAGAEELNQVVSELVQIIDGKQT